MNTLRAIILTAAFAAPALAQLQTVEIVRTNDVLQRRTQDAITWYSGETVNYSIYATQNGTNLFIPTNAVPIWYAVDGATFSNYFVFETGTVVSAEAGHVRFALPAARSALPPDTYEAIVAVYAGNPTGQPAMVVLDRFQADVLWSADYTGLYVGPTTPTNIAILDANTPVLTSFWTQNATNISQALGIYDAASLQTQISNLTANLTITSNAWEVAVSNETAARVGADAALSNDVATLTANLTTQSNAWEAAVSNEAATRAGADAALSNDVGTLTADLAASSNAATAGISAEAALRAGADAALSNSVATLAADLATQSNAWEAAVSNEAVTRAGADAALSNDVATLTADLAASSNAATAGISAEAALRAGAAAALSNSVAILAADLTTQSNAWEAAVSNEATARASADAALSNDVATLTADLAASSNAVTAGIIAEAALRVGADAALSNTVAALAADLTTQSNAWEAAVSNEATARAGADAALSNAVAALPTMTDLATASANWSTNAAPTDINVNGQSLDNVWVVSGPGISVDFEVGLFEGMVEFDAPPTIPGYPRSNEFAAVVDDVDRKAWRQTPGITTRLLENTNLIDNITSFSWVFTNGVREAIISYTNSTFSINRLRFNDNKFTRTFTFAPPGGVVTVKVGTARSTTITFDSDIAPVVDYSNFTNYLFSLDVVAYAETIVNETNDMLGIEVRVDDAEADDNPVTLRQLNEAADGIRVADWSAFPAQQPLVLASNAIRHGYSFETVASTNGNLIIQYSAQPMMTFIPGIGAAQTSGVVEVRSLRVETNTVFMSVFADAGLQPFPAYATTTTTFTVLNTNDFASTYPAQNFGLYDLVFPVPASTSAWVTAVGIPDGTFTGERIVQVDADRLRIRNGILEVLDEDNNAAAILSATGGLRVGTASFYVYPSGDISQDNTNTAALGVTTIQSLQVATGRILVGTQEVAYVSELNGNWSVAASNETALRIAADAALSNSLAAAIADILATSNAFSVAVSNETAFRIAADAALSNALAAAVADNLATSNEFAATVSNETAARIGADASLSNAIAVAVAANLATSNAFLVAVSNETVFRIGADAALSNALAAAVADNLATSNEFAAAVSNETAARIAADAALSNDVATLTADLAASSNGWSVATSNETVARIAADAALSNAVAAAVSDNIASSNAWTVAWSNETAARIGADTALSNLYTAVNAMLVGSSNSLRVAIDTNFAIAAAADAARSNQAVLIAIDLTTSSNHFQLVWSNEVVAREADAAALSNWIDGVETALNTSSNHFETNTNARLLQGSPKASFVTLLDWQAEMTNDLRYVDTWPTSSLAAGALFEWSARYVDGTNEVAINIPHALGTNVAGWIYLEGFTR